MKQGLPGLRAYERNVYSINSVNSTIAGLGCLRGSVLRVVQSVIKRELEVP